MRLLRLCLLLLLSTALITSCKKPVPKQTRHISKNAVFVATINTKSLQEKLIKNQATLENIIRNFSGNDTTVNKSRKELEDLKSSGIDFDENFYVAVVSKGGGMTSGSGSTVTSAIGSVDDAGKLEAYLKKKDPASEVRKEKDYSYTTMRGDNMVAWNKEVVILMSYQKSFSPHDMEYDSTTGSYNLSNPGSAVTDMRAEVESAFNRKEAESVASIPEFRDLMQEKSDASMWVNSSSSMENLPLPLPRLKELLANNFTAAKIDFDDGKIEFSSKSYYSKDLRDILKRNSGTTADLAMVENYPSDNINGFAAFSFNPQLMVDVVKYLEVGGMVDAYLTKMMGSNYTLQDAIKAIKGDFAIVISDFASSPSGDNTQGMRRSAMPNLKMIVNIPVGDKAQMNRLMDKLVQMQMLEKANNEYRLAPALQQVGYQLNVDDRNLIIASDQNLLTQYKAKSKKAKLNSDVMDDLKGKPGIAYVNIESILNSLSTMSTNGTVNSILPKAKETFKELKAYSSNFNGKYMEGHAEIRFKNEKENSFTSLLGFVETVSKNVKTNGSMANGMPHVQADTVGGLGNGGDDVQTDTAYNMSPADAEAGKRR